MGVFEQGTDRARARQKQDVLDEAGLAGSLVTGVHEYATGGPRADPEVCDLLASAAEEQGQTDALQLFQLSTGVLQHLYVQPYAGLDPLPGEHHARLEGTLASPAILRKRRFGSGRWDAGDDRTIARMLAGSGPLGKVIDKLRWDWKTGATKIGLPWLVQLRPLAGGGTHLVMRAGRYGGAGSCRVGLPQFVLLCKRISPLLAAGGAAADAAFLQAPAFAALFEKILLGRQTRQPEPASAQASVPPAEETTGPYNDLIHTLIGPRQGRRIHVAPVPEKKARAVRAGVLPDGATNDELVALIDLTMMTGTARDAVVFTPSHCHAKEVEVTASFPLDRLVQVHGYANRLRDRIDVEIEGRGRVRVPVGSHGPLLLELFQRLATHNCQPAPDA